MPETLPSLRLRHDTIFKKNHIFFSSNILVCLVLFILTDLD